MAILKAYDWPGNVRELKNVAERIVVRWRGGPITAADLPTDDHVRRVPDEALAREAASMPAVSRAQTLFDAMTPNRERFLVRRARALHVQDLTRQDLRALIRLGLSATRGSYRSLSAFNMPQEDYKRFLNFLRKHEAHLPIHEFRSADAAAGRHTGDFRRPAPAESGARRRPIAAATFRIAGQDYRYSLNDGWQSCFRKKFRNFL